MTDKFKSINKEEDNQIYNHKKISLPYTIFGIKPHVCVDNDATQQIIDLLEKEDFEIRFVVNRQLTEQECENIYYKEKTAPDFKKIIVYNSYGPSVIMLLTVKDGDPVQKLKTLCGHADSKIAKTENPNSLRAKFGEDTIKNAVFCSENPFDANKERDIFGFPIPQKIPEFKFDKYLVSKELLWKFLHPPHLEHSDVIAFFVLTLKR